MEKQKINEKIITNTLNYLKVNLQIQDMGFAIKFIWYLPFSKTQFSFRIQKETFQEIFNFISEIKNKINLN